MVNWHQQGCLTHLKDQWLIDAAVRLNPKLRLSPKCQQVRYLNQNSQYISELFYLYLHLTLLHISINNFSSIGIITCNNPSRCFKQRLDGSANQHSTNAELKTIEFVKKQIRTTTCTIDHAKKHE